MSFRLDAPATPAGDDYAVVETDVLVIGGGIAGAFAAYRAAQRGVRVLLVDKSYFGRSGCSALASGVFPAYMPGDDEEAWLKSLGAGPLVNQALMLEMLPVSYDHLMTMDRWGVKWIKSGNAIVRLAGPGRDFESGALLGEGGPQMMMAVRRGVIESGVQVRNRFAVTDLLTTDGQYPTGGAVVGAIGFDSRSGAVEAIHAKATVVCTGPYKFPYPPYGSLLGGMPIDLSGDGIAFMLRSGAVLSRLELGGINILPQDMHTAPGLESLMPSGAHFIDKTERRFLEDYDPKRMELTSRAMLYFAIAAEKARGKRPAMDLRHVTPERVNLLKQVIPIILANYAAAGYDITRDPVPYSYQIAGTSGIFGAGASIGADGATSVPGLYAAGTCTDLAYLPGGHLPFCSALGEWAGIAAAAFAAAHGSDDPPAPSYLRQLVGWIRQPLAPLAHACTFAAVHGRLAELVTHEIGMILSGPRIEAALAALDAWRRDYLARLVVDDAHDLAKAWALRNYGQALEAILRASLYRTESRVAFIREDYPIIDNVNWLQKVLLRFDGAGLRTWAEPIPESFHVLPVRATQNQHAIFRLAEPQAAR